MTLSHEFTHSLTFYPYIINLFCVLCVMDDISMLKCSSLMSFQLFTQSRALFISWLILQLYSFPHKIWFSCVKKYFSLLQLRSEMRIRFRSDPLIFGPPDPDPLLFSVDPDPTCNKWSIKSFSSWTKYKQESTNSSLRLWVYKIGFYVYLRFFVLN